MPPSELSVVTSDFEKAKEEVIKSDVPMSVQRCFMRCTTHGCEVTKVG